METEEIKICTGMNTELGCSMLIFWYVNSIWDLEGGSYSSGEKRDPNGGK